MFQEINLCEDSDGLDNREWSNTIAASVSSLLLVSRKRSRDGDGQSNDARHHNNDNDPGDKPATGSADFVVNPELAGGEEVSVTANRRKRRDVMSNKESAKNDTVGKYAQILTGVEATEQDVGIEGNQVVDHRESHEGVIAAAAAAASHPMSLDSEQTSQDNGLTDKCSKKVLSSKPSSNTSGKQCRGFEWNSHRVSTWKDRLRELADYRKIHGHCNVPRNYSEKAKLGAWVSTQRKQYKLHSDGKKSHMTTFRIQELESLGFEWGKPSASTWEDRLRELTNYRKIHGHCNIPQNCSENPKLAQWVKTQRKEYRLQAEGNISHTNLFRVKELDSLDFEWDIHGTVWKERLSELTVWEARLSELADYRKIHGHCNVPFRYSENAKLAHWVSSQRKTYRLQLEGKASHMTTLRIKELENLGFEWDSRGAIWEDRLSELADYRKIHGHCNVPSSYSKNTKLATWVTNQKSQYKSHREGKTSPMTNLRIQELEGIGFEWRVHAIASWEVRLSELADYRKIHGHCDVPKNYSENAQLARWVATQRKEYRLQAEGKKSSMTPFRIQQLESLGFEWQIWVSWEGRLSELADFSKIHGHCNVPCNYSENTKLANWVQTQRCQYRLHLDGNKSSMTTFRIHELEGLGFEWKCSISQGRGAPKKPNLDQDTLQVREKAVDSPDHL
jgi:hypothetical protein